MKQLVVLSDARLAHSLVDYLSHRGLHCELTQSEVGITLWLADEVQWRGGARDQAFLARPLSPPLCRGLLAEWGTQQPYRLQRRSSQSDRSILMQAGPVTLIVMALCVCLYGLQFIGLGVYQALSFHPDLMQLSGWQIFGVS